jgi:hypothetical protein
MVNATSVNYNAIHKVYGGDTNVPLEGKERTYFYHWEESLRIHTKNLIFLTFQEDHINLCKQWVQSPTKREFEMNHARIEDWWSDSRATIGGVIQRQQFLLISLKFNNGYVSGLKNQNIWLITL